MVIWKKQKSFTKGFPILYFVQKVGVRVCACVRACVCVCVKNHSVLGYFRNLDSLRYGNEYCKHGKIPFSPLLKPFSITQL